MHTKNINTLFELEKNTKKNIIVLYPGKFQPMTVAGKEQYNKLVNKFTKESVYVISDDMVDQQKYPLTFEEKKKIVKLHGINNFLKSDTLYHATDIIQNFDSKSTIIVYAIDKNKLEKLSDFKRLMKYNNTSNLSYKDIQNPYVYYIICDNIDYDIPSFGRLTNYSVKKALGDRNAKLSELKSRFIYIFGWFDVSAFNLIISKFNSNRGKMIEYNNKSNPLYLVTRSFWKKVYEELLK
jgi:hypothetical protein